MFKEKRTKTFETQSFEDFELYCKHHNPSL